MIQKQLPDGTPYEVIEPGDPPRPQHNDDECGKCTFVAHPDFIRASSEQVAQASMTLGKLLRMRLRLFNPENAVVPLGLFTLPGWTGHNTFWLFQCPSCSKMCTDYLHGYRLYLKCDGCGEHIDVEGDRFYETVGRPKPPSRLQTLMDVYRQRRELRARGSAFIREKRDGVRVIQHSVPPVLVRPTNVPDEIKRQDESHKGSC